MLTENRCLPFNGTALHLSEPELKDGQYNLTELCKEWHYNETEVGKGGDYNLTELCKEEQYNGTMVGNNLFNMVSLLKIRATLSSSTLSTCQLRWFLMNADREQDFG